MAATSPVFNTANPYALASIVEAGESHRIVSSEDIYDDRGTLLWARNQPVSRSLQERLLARKLRQPLEACLHAEDGITTVHLHLGLQVFLASGHALALAVAPVADLLLEQVQHLPMEAAAQLLLTTVSATKPAMFEHAVRALAVAGALQASVSRERHDLRLAMLGGLFHDLGEMYVNPQYLDSGQALDMAGYRHVLTHPRIGELLLSNFSKYPPTLARAVGEHHERLDGNGYPLRRSGADVLPLGSLLAVTECAVGIASAAVAPLSRTALALRLVPGEHDPRWVGFFSTAARQANEDLQAALSDDAQSLHRQLADMAAGLQATHEAAAALRERRDVSALVRAVAAEVQARVHRFSVGLNSLGVWAAESPDLSAQNLFELQIVKQELRYRRKCMQRDCLWPRQEIEAQDAEVLSVLWGDSPVGKAQPTPA